MGNAVITGCCLDLSSWPDRRAAELVDASTVNTARTVDRAAIMQLQQPKLVSSLLYPTVPGCQHLRDPCDASMTNNWVLQLSFCRQVSKV